MRRQTRPFTVEVKQRRNHKKRGSSIWGDVDFSAALAETTGEITETQLLDDQIIDSGVGALEAENSH
ncbi:transposase, partial [Rhizobiaceae sp. 2RAB30]